MTVTFSTPWLYWKRRTWQIRVYLDTPGDARPWTVECSCGMTTVAASNHDAAAAAYLHQERHP